MLLWDEWGHWRRCVDLAEGTPGALLTETPYFPQKYLTFNPAALKSLFLGVHAVIPHLLKTMLQECSQSAWYAQKGTPGH